MSTPPLTAAIYIPRPTRLIPMSHKSTQTASDKSTQTVPTEERERATTIPARQLERPHESSSLPRNSSAGIPEECSIFPQHSLSTTPQHSPAAPPARATSQEAVVSSRLLLPKTPLPRELDSASLGFLPWKLMADSTRVTPDETRWIAQESPRVILTNDPTFSGYSLEHQDSAVIVKLVSTEGTIRVAQQVLLSPIDPSFIFELENPNIRHALGFMLSSLLSREVAVFFPKNYEQKLLQIKNKPLLMPLYLNFWVILDAKQTPVTIKEGVFSCKQGICFLPNAAAASLLSRELHSSNSNIPRSPMSVHPLSSYSTESPPQSLWAYTRPSSVFKPLECGEELECVRYSSIKQKKPS